jgi:hypothetical protein
MRSLAPVLLALACFTLAPSAEATTLFVTPQLGTNNFQIPECTVTNADKKPITVTVELLDVFGAAIAPTATTCPEPPLTLGPRETCQVASPPSVTLTCWVTSSSKRIRAGLNVYNGTTFSLEAHASATP